MEEHCSCMVQYYITVSVTLRLGTCVIALEFKSHITSTLDGDPVVPNNKAILFAKTDWPH